MTTDCGASILVIDPEDDHRRAVTQLLQRVGFSTREEATAAGGMLVARDERPALVLLEVDLGDANGYELCRQLRDVYGEELPIIFLAGRRTETADRIAGLLIGADDYIVKPFSPDELVARIRRAMSRSSSMFARRLQPQSTYGLTSREREVLRLLALGLSQTAIARELFISPQTVATHIQRVLTKLGVHSRAEAVAFAHREHLVDGALEHGTIHRAAG